ncbi:MAG: hypothetical protein IJ937_09485, partial [Treponema sp.]|nr:hypothetical protein [Treponema sp.]
PIFSGKTNVTKSPVRFLSESAVSARASGAKPHTQGRLLFLFASTIASVQSSLLNLYQKKNQLYCQ